MSVSATILAATVDGGEVVVRFASDAMATGHYLGTLYVEGEGRDEGTSSVSPLVIAHSGFEAGLTYSVGVRKGAGPVPPQSQLRIVGLAPALAKPVADESTVAVELTQPNTGNTTVTGYRCELLRDGVAVASELLDVHDGKLALSVQTAAAAPGAYALRVRALAGAAVGPPADLPVLLATPRIAHALVAPDAESVDVTVELGSVPPAGAKLEAVVVADGVRGTPMPVTDGHATVPIPPGVVQAAVAARGQVGGATGPWSEAVPLPLAAPVIAARCDGGWAALTWNGDSAGSYRAEVAEVDGAVSAETVAEGLSTTLPLTEDPARPQVARVTPLAGVAVGPTGELALVTAGCPVTSAGATAGGSVTLAWHAPPAPGSIDFYEPVALWGGTATALPRQPGGTTSATIELPDSIPGDAALAVRALAGSATGPLGSAAAVVRSAPTGLELSYETGVIHARWQPLADARVDGYNVVLNVTGTDPSVTYTSVPERDIPYTPPGPPPDVTATVAVNARAGLGTGPRCDPVEVIIGVPDVTVARADRGQLALAWSGVADPAASEASFSLLSGGTEVGRARLGGNAGAIELPPGAPTLRARAVGAGSEGPLGEPLPLLTAAPVVNASGVGAASGALTTSWDQMPGAAAYDVEVRTRTDVVLRKLVTAPRLELTAEELPPAGAYAIRARALASASSDAVAGPWSTDVGLLTAAPDAVTVRYDGRMARVSWEPLAGAEGYVVTLLHDTDVVASRATSGTTAELPAPFDAGRPLEAVVQAATGAGRGSPSPRRALFETGLYLSTSTTELPHVLPANADGTQPHDIVVYLPEIFTTHVPPERLPKDPPFEMGVAEPPYVYSLTMPAASAVWDFSAREAVRKAVRDAYGTLLVALKDLKVTAMGLRTMQDAIARAMPQTFEETLLYGCGFAPGGSYVDLRPGMVLRAEYQTYQYLSPTARNASLLAGFAATSTVDYDIGSYVDPTLPADSAWLTGLDAFLSRITASGTTVPAPDATSAGASGGGGAIDSYYAQLRKPFVRIVYPPDVIKANSDGNPRPEFNVALLAASSYATLEDATQNLRDARPLPTGAAATYLRGRATLSACVRIWVDGVARVVPLGTTVGNVLESMGRRPAVQQGLPLTGIELRRSIGAAVIDPAAGSSGYDVAGAVPVHLDWMTETAYDALTDWLSLPLMVGDRLSTQPAGR